MRIRTIKPEFWMHEKLAEKSEFTRLLAIAILNWADDEGYFMANPTLIKGQLFPFLDDSKIIPRSIQDLSSVGWIELSEDEDGRSIGRVTNFAKHQRVDKPKPSIIKPLWTFQDASKMHPRSIQDASKEEGKGMERNRNGIGKEVISEDATILRIRLGRLFGRKAETKWSEKEVKSLKAIKIDSDDLSLIEDFYNAIETPSQELYRRTSMLTLLNNWNGEVDKAKKWKSSNKNRFAGTQEEIELP
jgi:hypothetical protein